MLNLAGPVPDLETLHPTGFYRIQMSDYCQQKKKLSSLHFKTFGLRLSLDVQGVRF